MTTNQINYWTLQETKQHNRNTEYETTRHNQASEALDLGKLNETIRHNKASEGISQGQLSETTRHNLATESVEAGKLAETSQHNRATESLEAGKLAESTRHNTVSESQNAFDLNMDARKLPFEVDSIVAQTDYTRTKDLREQVNTDYDKVKRDYADVTFSLQNQLTDAQKRQLNAAYSKALSDIKRAETQNTIDTWNAANSSVNALARIIDAVIPG